ncbi:hypothetical protein AB4851_16135 [Burkholderia sp. 22PA0099]|uniref:hypothetical protein n=1 Tax=Burkholderia sp. 22PA0099 TaxID=3237372 RepID=UPI0039C2498B
MEAPPRLALAKTNVIAQGWVRTLDKAGRCAAKMRATALESGKIRMKIFETLVVIGFALRYHSKRRKAEAPQAPSLLRGAAQSDCALPSPRTAMLRWAHL